jgi:undecaprenyl-diphosphatase
VTNLDYIQAAVLGAVQGVTEFLPISSSGHLAILQNLFGLNADAPEMILFDVVTHVGTLIAVAVVFASPFARYLRRLAAEITPEFAGRRHALYIAGLAVAALIPTAAIGLTWQHELESAFGHPRAIALAWIVTGGLLWVTGWIPRPGRGWRRFGWWRAVLVGVAQACALWPGISRSGATICTAEYLGLKRRWAAQFSFLIAAPAICGATLLKIIQDVSSSGSNATPLGPILVGGLVSVITGYVALRVLLSVVQRAKLHYFSFYCWAIALAVLILPR